MIKRFTAYSFILLATIVILANAVLPHHHHQNIICIESSHCQCNNNADNSSQEDNHQHDCSGSTNCLLKQAFIIPSNQDKDEFDFTVRSHNHSPYSFLNLPYSGEETTSLNFEVVASIPYAVIFFSSYINTTSGLRAPPML